MSATTVGHSTLQPPPDCRRHCTFPLAVSAGTLDPTFGTGGRVTTNLTADDSAYAAALQADGKTVVALSYILPDGIYDVAVVRYLTGGEPRPDLRGERRGGHRLADARGLVIQSDGRIVVATSSSLLRLNPNGTPDTGFGISGTVAVSGLQAIAAVALKGNDILVAGLRGGGPPAFAVVRYTPNGTPDLGFGPDRDWRHLRPIPRPLGISFPRRRW